MLNKVNPFIIETVYPCIDGGRYPVKREVGDTFTVRATVFKEGHDAIVVLLKHRERATHGPWSESPMTLKNAGLDIYEGHFNLPKNTRYQYTVEAYTDLYKSWLNDTTKKFNSHQDVESELIEGYSLVVETLDRVVSAPDIYKSYIQSFLTAVDEASSQAEKMALMSDSKLVEILTILSARGDSTVFEPTLEVFVDRVRARYGTWYEMFPRSQGNKPGVSATFKDCIERLTEVKYMGFDVVYFTPIHPIGVTKRKGPNNSLICGPNDPGCPYAIGSDLGGHKAIEPGLGTFEDFAEFEAACKEKGMEVAIDFAINCSPDHPYVKEHPDWFFKRPDGTIKYAENPPKKYEDIYPLNFYAPGESWKELWAEMRDIILFWCARNVRIFRVDNPHTKPVPFWQWLIAEVQDQYPDAIFLSEAFTRPPMMEVLAKAGFTQSYTYFTWRNFKSEIIEYFSHLTQDEVSEYLRGNLFANTPDILPQILQQGGRPAFKMRLVLAATLGATYGIYNGFELCENAAIQGKEEYLNSEKYDYKVWDWDREGNIKDYIARVNRIRHENVALHYNKNLRFYNSDDENILFYGKTSDDGSNTIFVVVNLDPFKAHQSKVYIPTQELGIKDDETYELLNLITDEWLICKGQETTITLDPAVEPAFIFRLIRWVHKEEKFDYFQM